MARFTDSEAVAFAADWVSAWNAHDLDKIMAHYADDVVLHSPVVVQVLGDPRAVVVGKEALRNYFQKGLEAFPTLQFGLQEILLGSESLVLLYNNQKGTLTAEYMEFNDAHEVKRVRAHYNLPAS